jgi:hypothetical protein
MRYKLQRNANGMITQCDNADGGNIYAEREEINKKALENLKRPTPGKLGDLSNCQVLNFSFNDSAWTDGVSTLNVEYNTNQTTGNVTDCVMFGVDGLSNKAQYFNLVDLEVNLLNTSSNVKIFPDSYIEWYILENIETSTSSLGRKQARRYPIFGADSSATFNFTTTGAKQGYQYITSHVSNSSNPINTIMPKGLRCSGIALKTISVDADSSENWSDVDFNVIVQVDATSVSSTY